MPKLSMGGKVKHYPYTPDGKLAYERDKARLNVSPSMDWNEDEAGLPYVYKNPRAAKENVLHLKWTNLSAVNRHQLNQKTIYGWT